VTHANLSFIGVDLGGTGTRVVCTDAEGTLRAERSLPTETESNSAIPNLTAAISEIVDGPLGGIGIGASGPIDGSGIIRNPATLPAYTGLNVCEPLREQFGVPVHIDNDAVTAAYAEVRIGAGRGARAVLTVTLGTGVGVAMLTDGVPHRTGAGVHPEAGHLWVPGDAQCYCGRTSCWEQQASRAALQRATAAQGLGLDEAFALAQQGDGIALELFASFGQAVAHGLADLLTAFGPDRVVLGGGAARFLKAYSQALETTLYSIRGCYQQPPLVTAKLGDLAGASGAALWVASLR
jgi:glucokinase